MSYQILVNGVPSYSVIPIEAFGKEILSYLICIEGLSALIRDREGRIYRVKVTNTLPIVSHLFFIDGNLPFMRATLDEAL